MGCTSPLYRVPKGSWNWTVLHEQDRKRVKNDGVFLKLSDLEYYSDKPGFHRDEVQVIRCGQCTDCRLNYSRDWAVRCSLEASMHQFNYFVTLTYDDNTVPRGEFIDYDGDYFDTDLCRRDIQLFVKNLREWERKENGNTGIKVFYCGEYGGLTSRPHYHICIFGCSEIPDLVFHHKKSSFNYYKSAKYEDFWSTRINGIKVLRGFVDISEVSFDSIAYTARYVLKKQKGLMKKDFMEYYDCLDPELRIPLRTQPFVGMSLKPGIAAEYYREHKDQIYSEDLVKYQKKYKLFCSKPPRYFDYLYDIDDPEAMEVIKRKRLRGAVASTKQKYRLCSEPLDERLKREELMNKIKEEKYYVRGL